MLSETLSCLSNMIHCSTLVLLLILLSVRLSMALAQVAALMKMTEEILVKLLRTSVSGSGDGTTSPK